MVKEKITPRNPELWKHITDTMKQKETLPIFGKSFEIVRTKFFLRPDVMKWQETLAENEPYGVFRYRWSDANTTVFTLAMFAEKEQILFHEHPGYGHGKDECQVYINYIKTLD